MAARIGAGEFFVHGVAQRVEACDHGLAGVFQLFQAGMGLGAAAGIVQVQDFMRDPVDRRVRLGERGIGRVRPDAPGRQAVIPVPQAAGMVVGHVVGPAFDASGDNIHNPFLEQDVVDLGHLHQRGMAIGAETATGIVQEGIVGALQRVVHLHQPCTIVTGPVRDTGNTGRDFGGRGLLLLQDGGNFVHALVHVGDLRADGLDEAVGAVDGRLAMLHGAAGAVDGAFDDIHATLERGDAVGNVLCRAGRLVGERFHFRGDDGKTLSGLARAGGFDSGVERQKIGLVGNRLDHRQDGRDLFGGFVQFGQAPRTVVGRACDLGDRGGGAGHGLDALVHRAIGFLGQFGGAIGIGGNLVDRGDQFFRCGRDGLAVAGRLVGGCLQRGHVQGDVVDRHDRVGDAAQAGQVGVAAAAFLGPATGAVLIAVLGQAYVQEDARDQCGDQFLRLARIEPVVGEDRRHDCREHTPVSGQIPARGQADPYMGLGDPHRAGLEIQIGCVVQQRLPVCSLAVAQRALGAGKGGEDVSQFRFGGEVGVKVFQNAGKCGFDGAPDLAAQLGRGAFFGPYEGVQPVNQTVGSGGDMGFARD